jgi:serine/threonine-protein kinase HipA
MTLEIHVMADWLELAGPKNLGLLRVEKLHGRQAFSFEYARHWLESGDALQLDPELLHYEGPQYLSDAERPNFGMFLDSCPDRWGQLLMRRREAQNARQEGRRPRVLLNSDYLLGVDDEQRMGGLRFQRHPDGEVVSTERDQPAPPRARLRELENAAWKIQAEGEACANYLIAKGQFHIPSDYRNPWARKSRDFASAIVLMMRLWRSVVVI